APPRRRSAPRRRPPAAPRRGPARPRRGSPAAAWRQGARARALLGARAAGLYPRSTRPRSDGPIGSGPLATVVTWSWARSAQRRLELFRVEADNQLVAHLHDRAADKLRVLDHQAQALVVVQGPIREAQRFEGRAAGGEDVAHRPCAQQAPQFLDAHG